MADETEVVPVRFIWESREGAVAPVNQLLLQMGAQTQYGNSHEFFLTLGHSLPPIITGPQDMPKPNADGNIEIPITHVGTFAISWERLVEFSAVLGRYVADIAPIVDSNAPSFATDGVPQAQPQP